MTDVQLDLDGDYVPAHGEVFTVVSATSLSGQFHELKEGDSLVVHGVSLTVRYTGTTVSLHAPALVGTRLDLTIVHHPSDTDPQGELPVLPDSADWVHEWQSFWVETWVSTPESATVGVAEATVDLQYHTDYLTAMEIVHGPAFSVNPSGTIDDTQGLVSGLGGRTNLTTVGDDAYVLLARIKFPSTGGDQVPVDAAVRNIGPYDMELALASGQTELVDVGTVVPELVESPATELWAVMYDMEDNHQIDFGELSFFAAAFGRTVGARADEPPFVWWADFDRSGRVDFGDLAFFAPNFNKNRTAVQSGDQTLVFPSNFPDAWRAGAGGGVAEGESVGESESEGEARRREGAWKPMANGVRLAAGVDGLQHGHVLLWQSALAVDEAHVALQAEQSQGFPWGITAGHEVQPTLPLWQESHGTLHSRSGEPEAASDERPERQSENGEPLEDLLASLAVG